MRWIRHYSITQKLTWMNMLVSGSALILACAAFMVAETIIYTQGMVRGLSTQSQVIGANCVSSLIFNDPQAAENTLAALQAASHVTSAWIYSPDGHAFAGYTREGKSPPPALPAMPKLQIEDYRFKDGRLRLMRAVIFHDQLTAYVYIESDLGGLYERLGTYAAITAGVLLASLLAALLVSAISQRVVAKPIQDLSETARAVSRDKNYAVRAQPTDGRDEISVLIDTFNGMLAQIQEREAEREQLLKNERTARAEAERVSVLKDEFLATLSHELRTPLNAIVGWAHVLGARGFNDKELNHGLSVIERNTRAEAQLVEDMLDMSRIISGKTRLNIQEVDVVDVVNAAVASAQHSAEAKGIRLETMVDGTPSMVRGDPQRLHQCLSNLLSNAIKFTPTDGRVQIQLQRRDGNLEVRVVDNGEGIPPEFVPHVFERFRQADASTTRLHGGLGLGLSIVKHLVELHGGKVLAQSDGLGKGAAFVVTLPLLTTLPGVLREGSGQPAGPAEMPAAADLSSLAGISVLVVDDEPDARDLIKHILESCGARVVLAASSQEALKLFATERPDIILSDIGIPGEDGYEFIRKVRALSPSAGGRTPAAALTAFARTEDRARALQAGYQSHAAKPIKPPELTGVVLGLAAQIDFGTRRR